jgi:S1-C subfamily serine protease
MPDMNPTEGADQEHRLPPLIWPTPPPPPGPLQRTPAPPTRRSRRPILAALLAALVLLASGIGIGWGLTRDTGSTQTPRSPLASGRTDTGSNTPAVADRVEPAVVDINTFLNPSGLGGPPSPGAGRPLGAGTGMVLTSTGEILTNNHVVDGATGIRVTIAGRSGTFPAEVVGVDPAADVALLQVSGVSGLPTVTMADSSAVEIGDQVVAIGNALGQGGDPTVTTGTVTGTGRSITVGDDRGGSEHLTGLIQTDAPIAPGDSGGPLVNASGQVVGMITASARSGFPDTASGVGFAIASNRALSVVNQVRAGDESGSIVIGPAGFLGVQVRSLDPQTADRLGLGVTSGALVIGVVPGTPAARAGIPQFAVITLVGGQAVRSAPSLGPALHSHEPGDQVSVTWVDRQGTHTVTVVLIAGPAV